MPCTFSDSFFTANQIQDRPRIVSDDIKNILKVIILTPKQINEKAKDVLVKYGLKFTPRPRSNHVELKSDIKKFCRKLRLIEYMEELLKDKTTYKERGENIDATVHRNIKALTDKSPVGI